MLFSRFFCSLIINFTVFSSSRHRKPPFRITHITKEPIVAYPMYNYTLNGDWTYKSVDHVVFPMGFTLTDDHIFVSYGQNDRAGWIVKLKKKEFIASLKPVISIVLGISDMNEKGTDVIRRSFRYVNDSPHHFPLPGLDYDGHMSWIHQGSRK
jgi:hypothetical protein